jgi:hypothetical protein
MKIAFARDPEASSSGLDVMAMGLDMRKQAKLFTILSDGLYKNKLLSIIRELCSNAYDSHVAAGRREAPIHVHVPTIEEPWLSIRDHGTGLTPEHAERTIFMYLGSDKDDSDEFIGGWGIGSKSPFAYETGAFETTLYKDGRAYEYNCWKDEDGMPQHALYSEDDTAEPDGVLVKLPLLVQDVRSCAQNLSEYLRFTTFNVVVTNAGEYYNPPPRPVVEYAATVETARGPRRLEIVQRGGLSGIYVMYGGFCYPAKDVGWDEDNLAYLGQWTAAMQQNRAIFLHAEVNDCAFAVSRETISGTAKTYDWITGMLRSFAPVVTAEAEDYSERFVRPLYDIVMVDGKLRGDLTLADVVAVQDTYSRVKDSPTAAIFSHMRYAQWLSTMVPSDTAFRSGLKTLFKSDTFALHVTVSLPGGDLFPVLASGRPSKKNLRGMVRTLSYKYSSYDKYKITTNPIHHLTIDAVRPLDAQVSLVWAPPLYAHKDYPAARRERSITHVVLSAPDEATARVVQAHLGLQLLPLREIDHSEAQMPCLPAKKPKARRHSGGGGGGGRLVAEPPVFVQDQSGGTRHPYDAATTYLYYTADHAGQVSIGDKKYNISTVAAWVRPILGHGEPVVIVQGSDTFVKKTAPHFKNIRPLTSETLWKALGGDDLLRVPAYQKAVVPLREAASELHDVAMGVPAPLRMAVLAAVGTSEPAIRKHVAAAERAKPPALLEDANADSVRWVLRAYGRSEERDLLKLWPGLEEAGSAVRAARQGLAALVPKLVWLRAVNWHHYPKLSREDRLMVMEQALNELKSHQKTN